MTTHIFKALGLSEDTSTTTVPSRTLTQAPGSPIRSTSNPPNSPALTPPLIYALRSVRESRRREVSAHVPMGKFDFLSRGESLHHVDFRYDGRKLYQGFYRLLHFVNHPDHSNPEQGVRLAAARRWFEEVASGNWLLVSSAQCRGCEWSRSSDTSRMEKSMRHLPPWMRSVKSVGCLPLAISHATSYMKQTGSTADDMLELYGSKHRIDVSLCAGLLCIYTHFTR